MASISYAGSSEYIERNTMRDICENIECLDDVVAAYDKWYRLKPDRAMAIDVVKLKERKKLVMTLWSLEHATLKRLSGKEILLAKYNTKIARTRALESCNKNEKFTTFITRSGVIFFTQIRAYGIPIGSEVSNSLPLYTDVMKDLDDRNCRLLVSNGNIETAFYNQLMAEPPGCQSGYIDSSTDTDACIRLPENSTESDSGWSCNEGFFKSGDTCKQNKIIPENATALGASWECNAGYAKKFSINENTGLVDFSCRLTLPENASENPYTESGWACNEGFIQDGETCK